MGRPRRSQAEKETATYACRACGQKALAYSAMAIHRKAGVTYVSQRCRRCENARKRSLERSLEQRTRPDAQVVDVIAEPDPSPVALLRELLRGDRDRGVPFKEVLDEDLDFALAHTHLRPAERESWRAAVLDTIDAWQAAYEGRPGAGQGITAEVFDGLSGADAREAVETGSLVVA